MWGQVRMLKKETKQKWGNRNEKNGKKKERNVKG